MSISIKRLLESEGFYEAFYYNIELIWIEEDQQYYLGETGILDGKPYERVYTVTSDLREAYRDYRHFTKVTESILLDLIGEDEDEKLLA